MSLDLGAVKQLRQETGAGLGDVQQALTEAGQDLAKAKAILRLKGLKIAAKKQGRTASQGIVDAYVHPPGHLAAMVTLLCETDFVARNEVFKKLAHDLAKQVAAMAPVYLSPADVPADVITTEKEIYLEQFKTDGTYAKVKDRQGTQLEKIMAGKITKYYEQNCLLEQPWINDDKKKIKDLITETTAKLGEKIQIREFFRSEI